MKFYNNLYANIGHYTATLHANNQWIECNDEDINFTNDIPKMGYLFLYDRVQEAPVATTPAFNDVHKYTSPSTSFLHPRFEEKSNSASSSKRDKSSQSSYEGEIASTSDDLLKYSHQRKKICSKGIDTEHSSQPKKETKSKFFQKLKKVFKRKKLSKQKSPTSIKRNEHEFDKPRDEADSDTTESSHESECESKCESECESDCECEECELSSETESDEDSKSENFEPVFAASARKDPIGADDSKSEDGSYSAQSSEMEDEAEAEFVEKAEAEAESETESELESKVDNIEDESKSVSIIGNFEHEVTVCKKCKRTIPMKNINRHFSQMRKTINCKSAYTSEDERLISSWFKERRAISQKEYREKNKKKIADWSKQNRSKKNENDQKWRRDNPEKKSASVEEWSQKNRDKKNENDEKWRRNNPEKKSASVEEWSKQNRVKKNANDEKWRTQNPEKKAESNKSQIEDLDKQIRRFRHDCLGPIFTCICCLRDLFSRGVVELKGDVEKKILVENKMHQYLTFNENLKIKDEMYSNVEKKPIKIQEGYSLCKTCIGYLYRLV